MFESLVSIDNINFLFVFLEGLISFLSPCVLPLIPLYMGYLAGNGKIVDSDGNIKYVRKKVLINTIFFVLGISTSFFIMGMSVTSLSSFFKSNNLLFSKIAGIVIMILGLFQLGILKFEFLQMNHKLNLKLPDKKMNPVIAYVMGFLFSFAWTPCVGPALSSVLILASSAKSELTGNLLVLLYTAGFSVPFLVLGVFTTQALNFIKKNRNIMKYTIKTGGIIMLIMGVMTFTGWINDISGYMNKISNNSISEDMQKKNDENKDYYSTDNSEEKNETGRELTEAIDFTLTDQYGNIHKLSDYKGKTVFLNFWATWWTPCRMEMPHIEELYSEYNKNNDDIVILALAQPGGSEKNIEGIKDFLKKNNYTYPVVFDESGRIFSSYSIQSLPTTYMINKEGKVYGYVSGSLSKDQMKSIINQTIDGK